MTFQTWWLYAFAVFLLSGTPGPNMLHVMTRSVEFGFRRSMAAMAGCMLAITLVLAASAAGLTALLKAIPGAFEVLRYLASPTSSISASSPGVRKSLPKPWSTKS